MEPLRCLKPGHYKVVAIKEHRLCNGCNYPLSMYNPTATCGPCSRKKEN